MATKTRKFEVHRDFIGEFFTALDETELAYELIELDSENEELIVEIEYSEMERDEVMNLIELLDEFNNEAEEEDEE